MHILNIWNSRNILSNRLRVFTTLMSTTISYALITFIYATINFYKKRAGNGCDGDGMLRYIALTVTALLTLASCSMLYVMFSIILEECSKPYTTLAGVGATKRQLVYSILFHAFVIDLICAAAGILGGLITSEAFLMRTGEDFKNILVEFEPSFILKVNAPMFAAVLLTMVFAVAGFIFYGKSVAKSTVSESVKKNSPVIRSFAKRLFGTGGAIEAVFYINTKHRRSAFVLAVVISLSTLFLISDAYFRLVNLNPSLPDWDVSFTLGYVKKAEYSDIIETIINDYCKNDKLIKEYTDCFLPDVYASYYSDEKNTTDELRSATINDISSNNTIPFRIIIMDNESFNRFAKEKNISLAKSGALIYNQGVVNQKTVDFLKSVPEDKIELYCMSTEDYEDINNNEGYSLSEKRDLIKKHSKEISIPVNTEVSDIPEGLNAALPAMIMPEKLLDRIKGTIPDEKGENTVTIKTAGSSEENKRLCENIIKEIKSYNRVQIREHRFGIGTVITQPTAINGKDKDSDGTLNICNLMLLREDYNFFINNIGWFYGIFFTIIFFTIAANIVNVVHMNRISRRREYAVLESLGISKRHRLGMILYEGSMYSTRSALFNMIVFAFFDPLFYMWLNLGMKWELLSEQQNDWYNNAIGLKDEILMALSKTPQQMLNYWWLFAVVWAAMIITFLVTDRIVRHHLHRNEIVQILKEIPYK